MSSSEDKDSVPDIDDRSVSDSIKYQRQPHKEHKAKLRREQKSLSAEQFLDSGYGIPKTSSVTSTLISLMEKKRL